MGLSMANITIEDITPALATKYLGLNKSNRNKRKGNITALASDMSADRWQETHMPLAFDVDGNLIDGQHRLEAVILSGKSQRMIVVREMAKSVQEVIDAGSARTGADALKLSGRVDTKHPAVAAATRLSILWDEGHHRIVRPGVNGARKVTNSEITSWVDDQIALVRADSSFLDITKAVDVASKWHQVNNLMSPSVTTFLFLMLSQVDGNDAIDFFNDLDGLNFDQAMGNKDPVKQLYHRLNEAKTYKEGLRISQVLYFVVVAWNAFRDGRNGGDGELRDEHGNIFPFVTVTAAGKWNRKDPKIRKVKGRTVYPRVPDPV